MRSRRPLRNWSWNASSERWRAPRPEIARGLNAPRGEALVEALSQKLGLAAGGRATLFDAPQGWMERLALPQGAETSGALAGSFTWILMFVRSRAELEARFPQAERALDPAGALWIAYPKVTSRLASDLTRDQGWDMVRRSDLKWTRLVSLDREWSAFGLRRYRRGEARQTRAHE